MLTTIIVTLLAILTLAYAAAPLIGRRPYVDPLPDESDPLLADLEEERDALLRAVREVEGRSDLAPERRDALRSRYEAKAAITLKKLEETRATLATSNRSNRAETPAPARHKRPPFALLSLLAIAVVTASVLGTYVLPRVGQGTVTTSFADDLARASELRDLLRAAERDASIQNLMRVAEAYWNLADAPNATLYYNRVIEAGEDNPLENAPIEAYKRLALLQLQTDIPSALALLKRGRDVDPSDPETMYAIGELSFALGEFAAAQEAFGAYLSTPFGASDFEAAERLRLIDAIAPASTRLAVERTIPNLLALADAFWSNGANDQAAELYFEVLSEYDAFNATALSRVGQLLFTAGRSADAVDLIERAASVSGGLERLEAQATLFLGNAYVILGDDENAIRAWDAHIATVGAAGAGRVTDMRAAAQTRLEGREAPIAGTPATTPATTASETLDANAANDRALAALEDPELFLLVGAELYAANCAICHGAQGQGGSGPRLAGNGRAADPTIARGLIRLGRGLMPSFNARLSEAEIELLARWVAQEIANPR